MNAIPRSPHALAAIALAVFILAACGGSGHGDEPLRALPTAAQTDAADDADAATVAAATATFANAAADVRARGLPSLYGDTAQALAANMAANDRFPGVKQINLVASKARFGAAIVEPELKNPWGVAIRPAGFGGHFWLGAAGTGKSIQYVGDVGGQPLFQDALTIVDTGGPVSGVAFNPGTGFVITQQHANGPITAPTKFFFANLSGTITAWTERVRPGGGFDHPLDSVRVVDGTTRGSSFIGVAVSPDNQRLYAADFGSDAQVRVFDPALVAFHPRLRVALDYVRDSNGRKVILDGLWGLQFGNGASLGEANHMYFASGPEKETEGLFGKLLANPNTLPVLSGVSMCK